MRVLIELESGEKIREIFLSQKDLKEYIKEENLEVKEITKL